MSPHDFLTKLADQLRDGRSPQPARTVAEAYVRGLPAADVFISAEFGRDDALPGQSKVGGRPDLPAGFEWPTEADDDEAPLQFLAQINLAEVHPHDLAGRLPEKGMLWFFSIADGDRAGGGEVDDSTTRVVFLAAPGPLSAHELPAAFADDEDAAIDERPLLFGPCVGLDGLREANVRQAVTRALDAVGGKRGALFMLNKRDDAADGVMLADWDCYRFARNAFGEAILGFQLSSADLAAGRLDRAETLCSSGS